MTPEQEDLIIHLAGFSSDPLGFVYFAFPWGEGELADRPGPEPWQVALLTQLRDGLITIEEAILLARTSGHGIGKSACVSWIILWAISTFEDTKGVITANTENQLKTKTWAEVAKWYRLCLAKPLFHLSATALYSIDPDHEKTWRIDMVPWSERNTEAFAGLHNQGKRILVIFDEASAIPDVIWEVTEGALTDRFTQIIWIVFGNPTRNKGRFRECFPGGKFSHRWHHDTIDSRTVSFTNKKQIDQWIEDYGLDSDFVRVRVRGLFPRLDLVSFISYEAAVAATVRPLPEENHAPVVLGVDVARYGDDCSVIYPRAGRDARSREIEVYRGLPLTRFAKHVITAADRWQARAIFIDGTGVGGGLVDMLRSMTNRMIFEVNFGDLADGTNPGDYSTKYHNKRSEIWGAVRDWLPNGCIPPELPGGLERTLVDELTGPSYTITDKDAIQLESKKLMRNRGEPSPDVADALAVTFAYPIAMPDLTEGLPRRATVDYDYNPYSRERMM